MSNREIGAKRIKFGIPVVVLYLKTNKSYEYYINIYIFVIDYKLYLFNNNHIIYRDLSLTVKYETFNLCHMGSNPIGLIKNICGYRSMVGLLSSKQMISVRSRLAAILVIRKGFHW